MVDLKDFKTRLKIEKSKLKKNNINNNQNSSFWEALLSLVQN